MTLNPVQPETEYDRLRYSERQLLNRTQDADVIAVLSRLARARAELDRKERQIQAWQSYAERQQAT